MKIYFANFGDDVKAYRTEQERLDVINDDLSLADDEEEKNERAVNIEQYEIERDMIARDENLVLERRACEEAQITIDVEAQR